MSSLIVEVCKIDKIKPHPNADALEVAVIKGWESCVVKGRHKEGEKVIYFPPDSILPATVSDPLGITKYLSKGRVLCANLRGIKSYGAVMPLRPDMADWEVGLDVSGTLAITKYEPPVKPQAGDAERDSSVFHKYYDMENIRNYPNLFEEGEPVIISEKVHGKNCRLGLIKEVGEDGQSIWRWAAGSHNVRRKQFDMQGNQSEFWNFLTDNVKSMLLELSGANSSYSVNTVDGSPVDTDIESANVVLFGEMYGSGVQDLTYGLPPGKVDFAAFDIAVNGKYLDYEVKTGYFKTYEVSQVPIMCQLEYNFDKIVELTNSMTSVLSNGGNILEGVVVCSLREPAVPLYCGNKSFSRKQLKCISFDYLNRKKGTEYH